MKIKKGDTVKVMVGKDKGKTGEVLKVLVADNKVLIKWINIIKKHVKATEGKQWGIISKEAPVQVSNVMYLEDTTPVRIGYRFEKDAKVRYSKKSGKTLS